MSKFEDLWDENHLPPFYGTTKQLMELGEVVCRCIDNCKASSNIREIVLETWITIDFAIRQLLLSGFNLTRFSDQELDIGYLIFPNSFRELVNILRKTRKYCMEHKSEPMREEVDRGGSLRASIGFWKFVKEKDPELFERIIKTTDAYDQKMHPELSENGKAYYIQESQSLFDAKNQPFKEFSDQWKEVICELDDNWFDMIDRLNEARNVAAHNYDAKQIARRFGKTEPDLVDKVKSDCFSLLEDLLNVRL